MPIVPSAAEAFPLGVNPDKLVIRAWGAAIESATNAGSRLYFDTRAALFAQLGYPAFTGAEVVADPTLAFNGVYQKSGAAGTGAWTKIADLGFATLQVTVTDHETRLDAIEVTIVPALDTRIDGLEDAVDAIEALTTLPDPPATFSDPAYMWGVADEDGRIAMGVDAHGRSWLGGLRYAVDRIVWDGGEDVRFGFVGDNDRFPLAWTPERGVIGDFRDDGTDAQPIAYTKSYNPGSGAHETIYLVSGTGETRLTDGTFDAFNPEVVRNEYVKYRSARDGTLRMWRASMDGLMDLPALTGTITHFLFYGQSNSVWGGYPPTYDGAITASPIASKRALMFNMALYPNWNHDPETWASSDLQAAAINPANMTYFVDAALSPEWQVEDHAWGFSEKFVAASPQLVLLSGHGVGGYGYNLLRKGTQPYENLLAAVAAGVNNARSIGQAYQIGGLMFFHGEGDFASTTYADDIRQLIADLNADVGLLTTSRSDLALYMTQVANWTAIGITTAQSPLEQLEVHETGDAILVTPTYHVRHNAGAGTAETPGPGGQLIHIPAHGIRMIGEKFAEAVLAGSWSPLRPTAITAAGTTITVSFTGRIGNLQLNVYNATTNPNAVVNPGNYGFELFNAGGVTITGVALAGGNTQVAITTSAAVPAGAELAYAYTGVAGNEGGPLTGPRGCLCDSDTTVPSAALQTHRASVLGQTGGHPADPLVNWCVVFRKPIPF